MSTLCLGVKRTVRDPSGGWNDWLDWDLWITHGFHLSLHFLILEPMANWEFITDKKCACSGSSAAEENKYSPSVVCVPRNEGLVSHWAHISSAFLEALNSGHRDSRRDGLREACVVLKNFFLDTLFTSWATVTLSRKWIDGPIVGFILSYLWAPSAKNWVTPIL